LTDEQRAIIEQAERENKEKFEKENPLDKTTELASH
jgi:hypothetical protein